MTAYTGEKDERYEKEKQMKGQLSALDKIKCSTFTCSTQA